MNQSDCEAERIIAALDGPLEDRIAAARRLKNAVVGNPTNKRQYVALGAVLRLTECVIQVDLHPELASQAVAAVGALSVFFSSKTINQVTPSLLRCLFSSEQGPVKAAARALKLFTCSRAFKSSMLSSVIATESVAARVILLLNSSDESISEVCAVIIAHSCPGKSEAEVYDSVGAIPALVHRLWRTDHERCVVACLNAFSALSRHTESISRCLVHVHGLIPIAMPLTRSLNHNLRLAACRLLTIFHSVDLLTTGLEGAVSVALVNLLVTPDRTVQTSAALTLSELLTGSVSLQNVANEAGAVLKLAAIIFAASGSDDSLDHCKDQTNNHALYEGRQNNRNSLRASAFTALAAVSSEFDSARDAIITYDLLPYILEALSQTDSGVVLAALKCIQSLGRSVKIVRRDLSNERIGHILILLLSSKNQEVRRYASGTLCNLVLEFSPIRSVVLNRGGPDILVEMLRSEDGELRANALWSLKNLLFKADCETKRAVMSRLGYTQLQLLCRDIQPRVRELAMTIVRNLACSGSADLKNAEVDALFAATGDRFVSILSEALKTGSANLDIAVQALYVVCNIASGTEHHKERLMKSDIPQLILQWTSHQDERARIAAVWCTINLSWKERPRISHRTTPTSRHLGRTGRSRTGRIEMLRRQHLENPLAGRDFLEDSALSERNTGLSAVQSVNNPSEAHRENTSTQKGCEHDVLGGLNRDAGRDSLGNAGQDRSVVNYGYEWRMERLRELGFEGRLRMLVNDPHIEVQGRARAALELFDCEDVYPLDCDPGALLDFNPGQMGVRQSPQTPPVLLRGPGSDSSLAGSSA